jgi:putative sigma-54 modulation protein
MSAKVDIVGRNLEITDRITDYVNKKVSKLDRFIGDVEEARVDLAYNKSARLSGDRQVAQITLRGKGFTLRTEVGADDIFAAFDSALDKMQRQIERFKGKRARGRGDGTPASEVAPEMPIAVEPDEVLVIARRKQFTLVPMDEVEAIEQMSLLGHENFFIFYNANSSNINVIYRRRDGTLGIIDPQVG